MSDLYRSVRELPQGGLDYLRQSLFWGESESVWYDDLPDEYKAVVDNAEDFDDITDEVLFAAYDGINFCPEDFVGMAGDDWSKV